ncbi:MAG: hypothetical protein RBT11_04785 [Desulfobacterales bacterium]|jgi:hypothetical protein|nr:hypothetical protein [Desulfobacterales bacterium]
MPYEDDFYKLTNVVGYTGDLIKREGSLYFEDSAQNKYGRITFGHSDANNNGRGTVQTKQNYKRKNMFIDMKRFEYTLDPIDNITAKFREGKFKTKVQIEYEDGQATHVSRGQFIKLSAKELGLNRAPILYILSHYPDQKPNRLG